VPTKVVIVSKPDYFATFSGGAQEYLSEPGITPFHIRFHKTGPIFSCPGGPSPKLYGKKQIHLSSETNLLAPIAKSPDGDWIVPWLNHRQSFDPNKAILTMGCKYGLFYLVRTVQFKEKEICIEDEFRFRKNILIPELRYFNFPWNKEVYSLSIVSEGIRLQCAGEVFQINFIENDFKNKKIEMCECIKGAKGDVQILTLRIMPFETTSVLNKKMIFSLKEV
jgi:hypothetical protein